MSDHTPTTERVRDDYATRMAPHLDHARAIEFDRWLTEVRAEAWDEGHQTPQTREPDGCRCGALAGYECACGRWGRWGKIITTNPYRNGDTK